MNRVFKICLVLIIFLASSGVVFASLNYNSANNFFVIDSNLKTDGNIIIGNLMNNAFYPALLKADGKSSTNFIAASRNLIFLNKDALFTSGSRKMNKTNFVTENIFNSANNDLEIVSIEGDLMMFSKGNVEMNQNFRINNGLTFTENVPNPIKNTIYVHRIIATNIKFLLQNQIIVDKEMILSFGPDGIATVNKVILDGKPFCVIKTWNENDNNANKTAVGMYTADFSPATNVCPGGDTSQSTTEAKRTCCDTDYYVVNADITNGKLICCRAR